MDYAVQDMLELAKETLNSCQSNNSPQQLIDRGNILKNAYSISQLTCAVIY